MALKSSSSAIAKKDGSRRSDDKKTLPDVTAVEAKKRSGLDVNHLAATCGEKDVVHNDATYASDWPKVVGTIRPGSVVE